MEHQLKESRGDEPPTLQASDHVDSPKPISSGTNEEPQVSIKQELDPDVAVAQESQEPSAPVLAAQLTTDRPVSPNTSSPVVKQEPVDEAQRTLPSASKGQVSHRLSTISTALVREVIPVSQDDPSSPWDMDSNPTPELSRTPTPEPCPSFTPVTSVSVELASDVKTESSQDVKTFESEDPMPPTLIPEGSMKKEEDSEVVQSIKEKAGDVLS